MRLLPTPMAHHSGNSPELHLSKKPGRKVVTDLSIVAANNLISTGGELHADNGGIDPALTIDYSQGVNWGPFAPAINRWKQIIGRTAPNPTLPDGRNGRHRLSAEFASWMQGWPQFWVTDPAIGLTRNQQLKAVGNGVNTRQAVEAYSQLFVRRHQHLKGATA